jgi:CRISPR-associated protein Csb1
MNDDQVLKLFDSWLKDGSPVAALVMRQWLVPVEGKDAVIFPPTYAVPEGTKTEDWLGYNIDWFENGSNVCQIDSVGSQANRIEPIFKGEPYSKLVPQIVINAGGQEVNLLDAGHRAADAIVRFSSLAPELEKAFLAVRDDGNAEPLAKIAPTSIVFGSWDSRSTQTKLPRIVRSVVRTFQVDVLHRSAQYTTIAGEILEGAEVEVTTKGPKAELGLAHVPAPWTHGGVRVREGGEIRRDASLNLVAIRALGAASQFEEEILKLRRYILGLSLVCFTAPQESFLREGCQLVPDIDHAAEWRLVHHDGRREPFLLSQEEALAYAKAAANAFNVGQGRKADFRSEVARSELAKGRDERRASRRRDRSNPERGTS